MTPPLIAAKDSPWAGGIVGGASFTIGAETVNAITVSVQLKDQRLTDLAQRAFVHWYLSGDVTGDTLAAAASSGVAGGTDGIVTATTTGRSGWAVSEADGDIDIVITDNTARTVYLVIVNSDGSLTISDAITFAT